MSLQEQEINSELGQQNAEILLQRQDFEQESEFQNSYLAGADLEGVTIYSNLENSNLTNANLKKAKLDGIKLKDSILINANLEKATLFDSDLQNANFENANLEKVSLSGANLTNANFKNAQMNNSFFIETESKKTNFQGANLTSADFQDAILEDANFQGANLSAANFQGVNLSGSDVSGTNFENAYEITRNILREMKVLNLDNALNIPENFTYYEYQPQRQRQEESEEPPEIESDEEYFEELREDQFISYFTLTGKLKSTKKEILINLNEKVESYDPIEMETINVTIKDYIKEDKDNVVIAYENREGKNEYFFTKRDAITTTYLDLSEIPKEEQEEIIEEAEYKDFYRKENFVFPCKKADDTALMPREENVIKYAYFDLAKLGFINAPQKYCDMQKYDINRNNQLFAVVPLVDASGEQANYPSFVGLEVHNNPTANLVSALHCQGGQENKVCRLIVATPTCEASELTIKKPKEGGRKKKTSKKGQKKSRTKGGKKKKTIKKKRNGNLIRKIVIKK